MYCRSLLSALLLLPLSASTVAAEGVSRVVRLDPVYFGGNGTEVMTQNDGELSRILEMMHQAPAIRYRISGYSDGDGSAKGQRTMAQRRAREVKAYLVERGIDASRLTTEGVITGDGEGKRGEQFSTAPVVFTAEGSTSVTLGLYSAPIQVLNFRANDYSYVGAAKVAAEYDFGFIPLAMGLHFAAGGGGAGYVEVAVSGRYFLLEQDGYRLAPYAKLGLLHAWQGYSSSANTETISGSGFLVGAGATFDYALADVMKMPFFFRAQAGFQYGAVPKGAMRSDFPQATFPQASAQSIGLSIEAAMGYTF